MTLSRDTDFSIELKNKRNFGGRKTFTGQTVIIVLQRQLMKAFAAIKFKKKGEEVLWRLISRNYNYPWNRKPRTHTHTHTSHPLLPHVPPPSPIRVRRSPSTRLGRRRLRLVLPKSAGKRLNYNTIMATIPKGIILLVNNKQPG